MELKKIQVMLSTAEIFLTLTLFLSILFLLKQNSVNVSNSAVKQKFFFLLSVVVI